MAKLPLNQLREQYWVSQLNLMLNTFAQGTFMLPEVQKSFNEKRTKIAQTYPKHSVDGLPKFLFYRQSLSAFSDANLAPFACQLNSGELSLGMFFPDIEAMDQIIRREKHDLQKMDFVVRTALTIKFLHEFDHMALGEIDEAAIRRSIEDTIALEARVWAETCRTTISLFVEVYGEKLCFSDNLFYTNWIKCGRNAQSQQWKDFIAGLYGKLKKV
ncbi:MAG: hypothetical protein EXS48_01575 [Candidatus Staskawiczbacteria bacterium]|nr:hypothetical protein [Candidatus Staskawiczbacteria bacterium]